MDTTSKVTTQKLHSVFRKAGLDKARWVASSMVRGWGYWTGGYRIEKNDPYILVRWQFSSSAPRSSRTQEMIDRNLDRLCEVLADAGLSCRRGSDYLLFDL